MVQRTKSDTNSVEICPYHANKSNTVESIVWERMVYILNSIAFDLTTTCSNVTESERIVTMNVRSRSAYHLHLYVGTFYCTEFAFIRVLSRNVNEHLLFLVIRKNYYKFEKNK